MYEPWEVWKPIHLSEDRKHMKIYENSFNIYSVGTDTAYNIMPDIYIYIYMYMKHMTFWKTNTHIGNI